MDGLLDRGTRRVELLEKQGASAAEAGADVEVIALRAAAEVLDRMSKPIANATRQWSWMMLDAACAKVRTLLVEAAGRAAGAPLEKDEDLWEKIRVVLERRGSTMGEPNYVQRISRSPGSGDLIAEYLAFIFSERSERKQEDLKEPVLRTALRTRLSEIHQTDGEMERFTAVLVELRANPLSWLENPTPSGVVVED